MASPTSITAPAWQIVPFDRVPVFRGLALALQDCRNHGWRGSLVSGDRRDSTLRIFNRKYGTRLHSQAYLYNGWIHRLPGFLPANPPTIGTHLLRGDGTVGRYGAVLPPFMLGLDVTEWGSLLSVARALHYDLRQPYRTASEAHHVNFFKVPLGRARTNLIRWKLRHQ